MKRIVALAILVVSAISLTACGTDPTVTGNKVGRSPGYVIVTDWTRIPSEEEYVSDIFVRTIKIEGICYLQSYSVREWQYELTPLSATC